MHKRDDFLAALGCRRPPGAVPIWEVEFQAWDAASVRQVVIGREFEALTFQALDRIPSERDDVAGPRYTYGAGRSRGQPGRKGRYMGAWGKDHRPENMDAVNDEWRRV